MAIPKFLRIGLVTTLLALPPVVVVAGSLGQLRVTSALGQPLDAEIDLMFEPSQLESMKATIRVRSDVNPIQSALPALKATISTPPQRLPQLRITSERPIDEPAISLLIEIWWTGGNLKREEVILLDPPTYRAQVQPAPNATTDLPPREPGKGGFAVELGASEWRDMPNQYIVQKGDTLWGIAQRFLKSPYKWPQLWDMNRDQIANPRTIYPGTLIRFDRSGASPSLAMGTDANTASGRVASAEVRPPPTPAYEGKDVLKLSKSDSSKASSAPKVGKERVNALQEEVVAKDRALKEAQSRAADLEKQIRDMSRLIDLKTAPSKAAEPKVAEAPKAAEPPKEAPKAIPKKAPPPSPSFTDELIGEGLFSWIDEVRQKLSKSSSKSDKEVITTSAKGAGTRTLDDLQWNLWMSRQEQPFAPLINIEVKPDPGAPPYVLTADLSYFLYRSARGTVQTVRAPGTAQQLKKSIEQVPTLQAFLLVDDAYLDVADSRWKSVAIPNDKLQPLRDGKAVPYEGDDVFAVLPTNPPFRLASVDFRIRAKKEGWARVSLVFFAQGRFVEEISTAFCVGRAQCVGTPRSEPALRGATSVRVSSQSAGSIPDAALYLLEFPSFPGTEPLITGVLSMQHAIGCTPSDSPFVWQVSNRESFKSALETNLVAIEEGKNESSLVRQGTDLTTLMFRGHEKAGTPSAAAYEGLKCLIRNSGKQATRRSLFARIIFNDSTAPAIVPFGLMVLEVDGKKVFAADNLRIELPLQNQNYVRDQACQQQWVFVLPPANSSDPTLRIARAAISDEAIKRWSERYDLLADNNRMEELEKWLNNPDKSENQKKIGLFVLSHHDRDALYFDSNYRLTGTAMKRDFGRPSFAILNACRTVANTGHGFVRQLDAHHVDAVIASLTNADSTMAGGFYSCFDTATKDIDVNKGATLGELFDATVACLHQQVVREPTVNGMAVTFTNQTYKYGPNAYKYMFLGNRNLRVCIDKGSSR